ncbi:HD domain protein [Raphanus sativus]|nr:HD domain protein [Raphanus sativus]
MAKDSPLSQPDRSGDGSTTPRAGWVKRELKNPESIADHMYRMGLMALVSTDIPGVNRDKCMKVAIVHDIAEAILGDITPTCGISKEEKKVKHFNTCANSWVEEKKLKKSLSCGENVKQTNHQKPREQDSSRRLVISSLCKAVFRLSVSLLHLPTASDPHLYRFCFPSTCPSPIQSGHGTPMTGLLHEMLGSIETRDSEAWKVFSQYLRTEETFTFSNESTCKSFQSLLIQHHQRKNSS